MRRKAFSIRAWQPPSRGQKASISWMVMRALVRVLSFEKRSICRCRAAVTRFRMLWEGSPAALPDRSSIWLGVQVQARVREPRFPQGQGFMAATSMKEAG